jgi:flagellar motor switch protein FliG
MAGIDYDSLTHTQKLAAFFITIGPEAASEMMKHFDAAQLETICREMMPLQIIDEVTQEKVIAEFSEVVVTGMRSAVGGASYAQLTLEKAKGGHMATGIMDRIAPESRVAEGGKDIRRMDAQQIVNLIKLEQSQTIAFVLSCVEAATAAGVVLLLSPELREEVVERLAAMGETPRDMVDKIAKHLNSHLGPLSLEREMHRGDGVQSAADILNALDKEMRKSMLLRIEERNADLGAAIRKKVFGFDDILRLEVADLQRVLREVDMRDLAVALKMAKPAQLAAVAGAMSKRAAQGLREEIDMLPVQKPKLIEEAQGKIIQIVLKLEEAEEITLEFGGGTHAIA